MKFFETHAHYNDKAYENNLEDVLKKCKEAMENAGCKITIDDIGKSEKLFRDCVKYSPYMRKRLTLLRMKDMIKEA